MPSAANPAFLAPLLGAEELANAQSSGTCLDTNHGSSTDYVHRVFVYHLICTQILRIYASAFQEQMPDEQRRNRRDIALLRRKMDSNKMRLRMYIDCQ
ncbi:hypothetical protein BST61_g9532 [Cercospora zeina]